MRLSHFISYQSVRANPIYFLVIILATLAMAGCSTVSIDKAKQLGAFGTEVTANSMANIFVTEDEFQRAIDAEAFFHGSNSSEDSPVYANIIEKANKVNNELAARTVVFNNLASVYDAFSGLAGIDAATGTETAINGLGSAINGYAAAVGQAPPIAESATAVLARIGGIIAAEIQKKQIIEASKLIRQHLDAFAILFEGKLVRTQMVTFQEVLAQNRATAIDLLWNTGVFKPDLVLNQMGASAGLTAHKDAAKVVAANKKLNSGLNEVVRQRLNHSKGLIGQSYNASIKGVRALIAQHMNLEKGEDLNLTHLRQIVAELQRSAILLSPPTA
ncbi:MAG: hypothetical protein ACI8ZB_005488 [Desulforhopalus sp.]|jgi:hypothetical protein